MSMREEFEKWWDERVGETSGPVNVYDVEAAWQAAYLAGAKEMQEEAEETVVTLYEQEELPYLLDITSAIRAINPANLGDFK